MAKMDAYPPIRAACPHYTGVAGTHLPGQGLRFPAPFRGGTM